MNKQLIECVPNISEGRDIEKINKIATIVTTVKGVKLLHIDIGKATNRTVITFVGEPENVIEAAFKLIKKASELIDMSKHLGKHPRFGATDVCPLIPVANISMEETIQYAHKLGSRVGKILNISGYFYENAAMYFNRKNLATIRSGEYEGLEEKLNNPNWIPDFGPKKYTKKTVLSGVIAISARNFLIAYNINLKTTSVKKANSIAFDVRESGRIKRDDSGKVMLDKNGKISRIPGELKTVKGLGWYLEDYGIAQVSYNLTNINITSMYQVFEHTVKAANKRGIEVSGSELIGLVPLKELLDTSDYFLSKQGCSVNISEQQKITFAVKNLGLNDLKPFNPKEKIIEYALKYNLILS